MTILNIEGEVILKMAAKKGKMDYMECCRGQFGLVHIVLGVGVGLLLVYYFNLSNLLMWGWALLLVGLLGHFVGKMKKY